MWSQAFSSDEVLNKALRYLIELAQSSVRLKADWLTVHLNSFGNVLDKKSVPLFPSHTTTNAFF